MPELLRFGREVCRVARPAEVIARLAQAMRLALDEAQTDERIPGVTLNAMAELWAKGRDHAR